VLSLWIVEHLGVVEHILSGIGPGFIGPAPYPFALEQVEEALRDRVVVTVAAPAHGMFKVVMLQEWRPVSDGELGTLVRVDEHLFFGFLRHTAISNACRTTSVVWWLCMDQPTTRRE
jgi:hypothetical protein